MKRVVLSTIVGTWLLVTALLARSYCLERITDPGAQPGYETSWYFQLVMFAIFRIPLLLLALGAFLWLVHRTRLGRGGT